MSNNYQQSIDPMTYRTTINDQFFIFVVSFVAILFLFHLIFNHFNASFFYQLKEYLFNSNAEKLDPYLNIRMNTILIFDVILSIILSFIFAPKFLNGQIIDNDAPRFDLDEDGLKNYYETEKIHSEIDMKIIDNFMLSKRNRETSFLLLGAPGSGKTQLINKWVNHLLHENRKMIIHDPKGDFADLLVQFNSNDVFIIAPWYNQTKALHFGKMVYSKDLNELSLNIDLFISSFFPRIDKGGNSKFFEDGARETLKAVVFKLCDEKKEKWTENDILEEIMNYKTSEDYLKLSKYIYSIKQYYEGENAMAQSIRGSMSDTLAKLETLKNFWKNQPIEKRISLDDYILDKTKYKHLILMNDIKYFNVAQSVISFSINYMTKFVLSQEYLEFSKKKKTTNNGNFELYFILDEFSSFAKFLDIPSFNQLSDLGRQAGIRLIASLQKYLQTSEFCKNENEMKNFLAIFPNRLIGAFAGEDKELLNQLFGSYKIRELKTATNINGAGTSNNLSGAEKEIKNDSSLLQNKLGVKKIKGKLKANFLIKTISNPIMAIIPIEIRDELQEIRKELKEKQEEKYKQKRFKKQKNRIEEEEKNNEVSLLNSSSNENDIIEELSKDTENNTINDEEEKIILEQKNDNTTKEQFKEVEELPMTTDDLKVDALKELVELVEEKNENTNLQI
jgi:hypothetical protein